MMLQGSLENFALDEVLGLLSGTTKTGQLEIAGNRGTGTLMFHQGRVVDGTASYTANGSTLEDVMFELLRYHEGTFTFHQREVTPGEGAENVASVLANAEARLRDWRSIESVVPSLNHQVAPAVELPADEVTITRAEWSALNIIASGCPASLVCDKLGLGEVEGSRMIKNLAERQLITVTEPIGSYTRSPANDVPEGFTVTPVASPAPTAPAAASESMVPAATPGLATPSGDRPPMPPAPGLDELPMEPIGSGFETATPGFEAVAMEAPAFDTPAFNTAAFDTPAFDTPPLDTPPLDTSTGFGSTPGMPPADAFAASGTIPPAPPSPSEIAGFTEGLADASELVEPASETKGGGILARYLKGDD